MQIIEKLDEVSRDIWKKIPLAITNKVHYGEETISDILLLELAQCYNAKVFNIKAHQTTKYQEALFGADWIWYIGTVYGKWLRLGIQAKKITPKGNYDSLLHLVKKKKKYQHEIFKLFSDSNNLMPFYCFYNYYKLSPKETVQYWRPQFGECDEELLGWTITPLSVIEDSINDKNLRNFKHIHRQANTIPIKYLLQEIIKSLKYQKNSSNLFDFENNFTDDLPTVLQTFTSSLTDDQLSELYGKNSKLWPKKIVVLSLNDEPLFFKN